MSVTASTTLRDLTGQPSEPSAIANSVLIMIDCQQTYREGVMQLVSVEEALVESKKLLDMFREKKRPIIHIVHDAGPGTPYDVSVDIGKIADMVKPLEGEPTVVKNVPNSFGGTDLHERLQKLECKELVLAGFMTHMCVNSTARAGFELGYRCTVVAEATATRNLPGSNGKVVDAATLKESSWQRLGICLLLLLPRLMTLQNKYRYIHQWSKDIANLPLL